MITRVDNRQRRIVGQTRKKGKIVKEGLVDCGKNVLQFASALEGLERSTREDLPYL